VSIVGNVKEGMQFFDQSNEKRGETSFPCETHVRMKEIGTNLASASLVPGRMQASPLPDMVSRTEESCSDNMVKSFKNARYEDRE
jgi:hypothetical protein